MCERGSCGSCEGDGRVWTKCSSDLVRIKLLWAGIMDYLYVYFMEDCNSSVACNNRLCQWVDHSLAMHKSRSISWQLDIPKKSHYNSRILKKRTKIGNRVQSRVGLLGKCDSSLCNLVFHLSFHPSRAREYAMRKKKVILVGYSSHIDTHHIRWDILFFSAPQYETVIIYMVRG